MSGASEVIHRHGAGNCATCPTRDICKELCSEVEALVNRDHVRQRHILVGDKIFDFQDSSSKIELFKKLDLTPTQEKVVTLISLGVPNNIIVEVLGISDSYVRVLFHRAKKKAAILST